ncbi:hypothetical protein GGI07_001493 [Coemansia sp. Benny D115]|nr:hypothetical protein GGI07_001493 [Coemansia sp. Benny D115]
MANSESVASTPVIGTINVPRVAGGVSATQGEMQFVAYVRTTSSSHSGKLCTGSLIAPNVVLTAGHCTYNTDNVPNDIGDYIVKFPQASPDVEIANLEVYSVSQVIVHPEFSIFTLEHDIALLILNETIPGTVANALKIYNGKFDTSSPIIGAGFGLTSPYILNSFPSVLQAVNLTLGTDEYCSSLSSSYNKDLHVCTDGTPGKDTCSGDSGGPLLTTYDEGDGSKYAILGITSYAPATPDNIDGYCAQAGSSGYYTYVLPYLHWIADSANLSESLLTVYDAEDARAINDAVLESPVEVNNGSLMTSPEGEGLDTNEDSSITDVGGSSVNDADDNAARGNDGNTRPDELGELDADKQSNRVDLNISELQSDSIAASDSSESFLYK